MDVFRAWLASAQQFTTQHMALVWGLVLASLGLMLVSRIVPAMARAFKTCASCRKVVPLKAEKCRYCGHAFPVDAPH